MFSREIFMWLNRDPPQNKQNKGYLSNSLEGLKGEDYMSSSHLL